MHVCNQRLDPCVAVRPLSGVDVQERACIYNMSVYEIPSKLIPTEEKDEMGETYTSLSLGWMVSCGASATIPHKDSLSIHSNTKVFGSRHPTSIFISNVFDRCRHVIILSSMLEFPLPPHQSQKWYARRVPFSIGPVPYPSDRQVDWGPGCEIADINV